MQKEITNYPHSTKALLTTCNQFADHYQDQPGKVEHFLNQIFTSYLQRENAKPESDKEAIDFCIYVSHLVRSCVVPDLVSHQGLLREGFDLPMLATQMLHDIAPNAYEEIQAFVRFGDHDELQETLEEMCFTSLASTECDEKSERTKVMRTYFGLRDISKFIYSYFDKPMLQLAKADYRKVIN